MKLYLASSRPIGDKCRSWMMNHLPDGVELSSMDDCDVFISVMYDKIIKDDFIRERRCYNFHPGVLPWYRGSGAYSWALMNGEFESGVTLHEIDKDIDHGNVIDIGRFSIRADDTAETLFHQAEDMIFAMFVKWFEKLLKKEYTSVWQGNGHIYYRKDLEKARDLTRFVRAFTFAGKPNAYFINNRGERIELTL